MSIDGAGSVANAIEAGDSNSKAANTVMEETLWKAVCRCLITATKLKWSITNFTSPYNTPFIHKTFMKITTTVDNMVEKVCINSVEVVNSTFYRPLDSLEEFYLEAVHPHRAQALQRAGRLFCRNDDFLRTRRLEEFLVGKFRND